MKKTKVRDESFELLFDRFPSGIFRATLEGRILYANPALTAGLRFPDRDALLNQPASTLFWEEARWQEVLAGIKPESDEVDFQSALRRFDGTQMLAEIHLLAVRNHAGKLVSLQGVVEKVQADNEELVGRAHKDGILAAVGSASLRLYQQNDSNGSLLQVLEEIGRAANVSRVVVYRNIPVSGQLEAEQVTGWEAPELQKAEDPAPKKRFSFQRGLNRWKEELAANKLVQGRAGEFPLEERDWLIDRNLNSLLLLPIFCGSEWWGFLDLEDAAEKPDWSPGEIDTLRILASLIGAAILLSESSQGRDYHIHAEELIADLSRNFIHVPMEEIAESINSSLSKLGDFAGVDRVFIRLLNPDCSEITGGYDWVAPGLKPHSISLGAKPLESLQWAMGKLRRFENVYASDIHQLGEEAASEKSLWNSRGIKSILTLPLIRNGELVGYLGFGSERTKRLWRDDDLQLLRLFGDALVNLLERAAVENALRESEGNYRDLARALERQTRELELLTEAREIVAKQQDLQSIYQATVEETARIFGYDLVSIYMLEGDDLILQHQIGDEEMVKSIPGRQGVVGRVISKVKPELVSDISKDPDYIAIKRTVNSEVCVPLLDRGKAVGVLNVESEGRRLDENDLRVMRALGEQVGIAIEKARLFTAALESEKKFRSIVQGSTDGIALLKRDTTVLEWNPALERILGITKEQALGRSISEVQSRVRTSAATSSSIEGMREAIQQVAAGKRKSSSGHLLELSIVRTDGERRIVQISYFPIQVGAERLIGVVMRDVTEDKHSDEAYRSLVDQFAQGLILIQGDRLVFANRAFYEILQIPPEEKLGVTTEQLFNAIQPEERLGLISLLRKRIEGRQPPPRQQFQLTGAEGKERWLEVSVASSTFQGKHAELASFMDVTARRRAEKLQDALYRISEAAYTSHEPIDLYASVHAIVNGLIPARNFYIAIANNEKNKLEFPYHVDEFDSNPVERDFNDGLTELVIKEGEALLVSPEVFEKLKDEGKVTDVGTPSVDWMGIPLKDVDNITFGAVVVQTYTEGVRYSQSDLDILVFVSHQISMTIKRKKAEELLRQSESKNRSLVEQIAAVLYRNLDDQKNTPIYISPQIERMLGYSPVGWLTTPEFWKSKIHPDDLNRVEEEFERTRLGGETLDIEYRICSAAGNYVWVRDQAINAWDELRNEFVWQGLLYDITERKQAEDALQQAYEKLKNSVTELEQRGREATLLNELSELLQSSISMDESFDVLTKYTRQFFPGLSGTLFVKKENMDHLDLISSWGEDAHTHSTVTHESCWALRRGRSHLVDANHTGPFCKHFDADGGGIIASSLCVPMVSNGEVIGLLHVFGDADHPVGRVEQFATTLNEHCSMALSNLALRESLRVQSIRDALTALYNRRFLEETLEREFSRADRHSSHIGLIMMDLDHFKSFNDSLGHQAGDALLVGLANFLQASIRTEDIACRYGGDEFVLILPDASIEDTMKRAEQLRVGVKNLAFQHRGRTLDAITVSLGVACFPEQGLTSESLQYAADKAMRKSKSKGGNQVAVADFDSDESDEPDGRGEPLPPPRL